MHKVHLLGFLQLISAIEDLLSFMSLLHSDVIVPAVWSVLSIIPKFSDEHTVMDISSTLTHSREFVCVISIFKLKKWHYCPILSCIVLVGDRVRKFWMSQRILLMLNDS